MAIITLVERSQIELMQNQQCSIQAMEPTLGRSWLSIRRELNRCSSGHYCTTEAQKHAKAPML